MKKNSLALLRYRLDPVALFEDVGNDKYQPPYEWQLAALRSRSKRQLYLCTRRGGKSSVAAIRGLYTAMFTPKKFVLFLSRSQDQSQEIFRKCLSAYRELGKPLGVVAESTQHLELQNGSRLKSISAQEDAGHGWSVDLLTIDEAATVKDSAVEGALGTITDGSIIALTTPKGPRGWFHDLWTTPGLGELWERYLVTVDEIPNPALHDMVEEARAWRGEQFVKQEYFCSFEADEDAFFEDPAVLDRSLTLVPEDEPLWFPERNVG
jgi:hypothetical protein